MKRILSLGLFLLLTGCATSKHVLFSYSGLFKLSLPAFQLEGATVFYSDELSIKWPEGRLVSAKQISSDSEELPESFDMRAYPDYILGLKQEVSDDDVWVKKFSNSMSEIERSFGLENLRVEALVGGFKLYSLCKNEACLAYVVNTSFSEHILSVHASGLNSHAFNSFLIEALNAE